MATNQYFNPFPANQVTNEQLLVEDLLIESMKIYGMDTLYLPRTSRDVVDFLYGEDTLKQYVQSFPLEMYLENVQGFEGEGDFVSKFGLEIRDEITLLVSRRRFVHTVRELADINRPREGDLVYVPLTDAFFEISFVEHENEQAMFYTLGRGRGANVYVYALKLRKFVFSNELVLTGNPTIDDKIKDYYPRTRISLSGDGTGQYGVNETVFQSSDLTLANASVQAVVHTFVPNTHMDVIRVQGTFTSANVIGETSNATFTVSTSDDTATMNTSFESIDDNARIEADADGILDFSETNPFGEA
jgi:hypothetical protein|tara:strand:- start:1652 stop:2557 length:906 start_codon:yes stop_codon:yes gene_type:complete